MRYAHLKKVLLVAVFSVLAVLVVLPVRSAYAEETAEPTKAECYDKTWTKSGDKDQGYSCSNGATTVGPYKFECPSGYGKDTTATKFKCVKAAPATPATPAKTMVEPTEKSCPDKGRSPSGDKDQGYWCPSKARVGNTYEAILKCPAGSSVENGEKTTYDFAKNVYKKRCVASSSSKPSKPTSPFAGDKKPTVSPTVAKCSKAANHKKGDSKSGFYCYDGNEYYAINFKCSTSSAMQEAVKDGITWRRCVSAGDGVYTAAGQEMLKQAPGLAEITSDPKVIGQCAVQAKDSVEMEKSRHSVPDEAARRQEIFAQCLAGKTGKSVDEVKAALGGVDPLVGATKGAEVTAATEQQLAQEQPAEGEEENKEECGNKLDAIGYFVCPLLEKLVEFADGTWGLFELLLKTDPLPSEEDNALRSAWNGLRDVANAILAIVFLAIIISQVSNIGISNYGVKKMLPRLIIAAIAINMSYFLMQIITDVANILGSTLYVFISELAPEVDPKDVGWGTIITDIIAGGIVIGGGLLAGKAALGAAAGMDAKVGLLLLLVFIVPAILGLIAGLMALVFRAGIIPVLAITSPIAMAAWVLPNTQKLFEKWKSTFLGMVFLYPLASLYCGGLKFIALTILSTKIEANEILFRMMAVTMLLLGCGFVAVLAIKSNSIMGGMINGIKNAGNKLTAPAVNSLSSYAGAMAGAAKARRKSEIASRDYSKETERGKIASQRKWSPLKLATKAKYAMGRRRQSFDQNLRAAKAQEAAFEQESQRKFDARVADDPSILGKAAQTVGGKAYIKEAAFKAAGMELQSKYNGNAVRALNESNDSYVKALAAKEIAERGSASEIDQVREYLQKGGSIDNSDMAEALMKMKGRDAGIAAAGKAALDKLEKSGGAPVHTGVSEMHRLTQEGFDKLGDKAAVEQNAAAIQAGGMDWEQAARVLGDRHIMREAPQENIGAIKASIQANITQQLKSGTMDGNQAQKVLNNSRAMENISDQTRQELQNIVNNAAKQAQANGAQTQSSGQPQSTSSGTQPVTSSGQARQAQAATQSPSAPKPPST